MLERGVKFMAFCILYCLRYTVNYELYQASNVCNH